MVDDFDLDFEPAHRTVVHLSTSGRVFAAAPEEVSDSMQQSSPSRAALPVRRSQAEPLHVESSAAGFDVKQLLPGTTVGPQSHVKTKKKLINVPLKHARALETATKADEVHGEFLSLQSDFCSTTDASGSSETASLPSAWMSVQTVMVRNIPTKYDQQMFFEELNGLGFAGTFDFMHLPAERGNKWRTKGYAFINFTTCAMAWNLKQKLQGQRLGSFHSRKAISVTPAALQGFEANYQHYATVCDINNQTIGPICLQTYSGDTASIPRSPSESQGSVCFYDEMRLQLASHTNGQSSRKNVEAKAAYCHNCAAVCSDPLHKYCEFCGTMYSRCDSLQ
jgi:hypothetical protein